MDLSSTSLQQISELINEAVDKVTDRKLSAIKACHRSLERRFNDYVSVTNMWIAQIQTDLDEVKHELENTYKVQMEVKKFNKMKYSFLVCMP